MKSHPDNTERFPGLIRTISPRDAMHVAGGDTHYFGVGADALKLVRQAISLAGKENIGSILDLPCGHGRVMRYLKAEFPQASLTACDLDHDAVDFCAGTFGAKGVYSAVDLSQVPIDGRFDLVFCGSLLTHFDRSRWVSWLRWFCEHLHEGGLLVFTTHGRLPYQRLSEHITTYGLEEREIPGMLAAYRTTGFGYRDYFQQQDNGVSISSPGWVVSQLGRVPDLRLVGFVEAGWDHHQDAVSCVRSAEPLGTAGGVFF